MIGTAGAGVTGNPIRAYTDPGGLDPLAGSDSLLNLEIHIHRGRNHGGAAGAGVTGNPIGSDPLAGSDSLLKQLPYSRLFWRILNLASMCNPLCIIMRAITRRARGRELARWRN